MLISDRIDMRDTRVSILSIINHYYTMPEDTQSWVEAARDESNKRFLSE